MIRTDILKGPDSFFLGANTPSGFYSLFDELSPGRDGRLVILKGGPGTGKSSFMKRIAAAADRRGLYCERIYCSSDPQSLDAVIIPGAGVSVADGTAPHVLEPEYPGVSETTVDLGMFRDDGVLRKNAEAVTTLTDRNKDEHKKCAAFLKAAAGARREISSVAAECLDADKVRRFCDRFASKELNSASSHKGRVKRRFLSALTPLGVTTFFNSVSNICERVIVLQDETGAAAAAVADGISRAAQDAGCDIIKCLSPMAPDKVAEHILIPGRRLAVFTSDRSRPYEGEAEKTVSCSAFYVPGELKKYKNRFAFAKKASNELLEEAYERLKSAKEIHDELEKYYIEAMDFDALSAFAEGYAAEIFG